MSLETSPRAETQRTIRRPGLGHAAARRGTGAPKRGHPWIYSNEVRMDAAAKALAPGHARHPAPRRRERARRRDVQPAQPGRRAPPRPRRRRGRSAGAFSRAGSSARCGCASGCSRRPYYRLVHAEADGLPGLVVDRFGEVLVVQSNAAGMARLEPLVARGARRAAGTRRRSCCATTARRARSGRAAARDAGRAGRRSTDRFSSHENGAAFPVDPLAGQKTGWFFDQRDNRALCRRPGARCARPRSLLLHRRLCGAGGARRRRRGARHRPLRAGAGACRRGGGAERRRRASARFRRGEAFAEAARLAAAGERFDIVIADPPAFAKSRKEVPAALRGYRKLARLAAALTAPRRHPVPRLVLLQCRQRRIRRGGAARARRCRPQRPHPAHRRRRARPPGPSGAARNRLSQDDDTGARLIAAARLRAGAGSVERNTVPAPVLATSIRSPPCARINSRAIARPSPVPPGRAEPKNGRNRFSRALGGRPGPSSAISIAIDAALARRGERAAGARRPRARCARGSTGRGRAGRDRPRPRRSARTAQSIGEVVLGDRRGRRRSPRRAAPARKRLGAAVAAPSRGKVEGARAQRHGAVDRREQPRRDAAHLGRGTRRPARRRRAAPSPECCADRG